jgi:phosphoglycerate dehydrogenase-like enzyme
MPPRKVLFGLPASVDQPNPILDPLWAAGFTVERVIGRWALSEDELIARLPGVCATIAGGEPYTERVFAAAPDLKLVARHGAGYEKVDLAAATRHGVAVTVTPGANANAVADMTLALMGAVRRNLLVLDRLVRAGGWGADTPPALWRSTVGIVGLGYIGKAVARRCVGFEMRLLAAEPAPDLSFVRQHGITLVDVDALCRQADIITLHAPATPENRHLINRDRLAIMKPTAILINTGRGTLVNEAALCEALSAGRLAGAGLDVFEREPPEGSPLLTMDKVVLTPHCAGRDLASHAAVLGRCVETILRFFRQEPLASPEDLLNPGVLAHK